jgi:3-hydroxyacyl-[acyl-carrier-protein] dehydratase
MSRLRKEIKSYMSQFKNDAKELTAHFCFSQEFVGFKGHFPERPVLPGVCIIQAVLCMLEQAVQERPKLKEIISAKFFAPVTCNEKIVFTVRQSPEGSEERLVKALITNGEKKIAEIKLRVSFEVQGGTDD